MIDYSQLSISENIKLHRQLAASTSDPIDPSLLIPHGSLSRISVMSSDQDLKTASDYREADRAA